MAYERMTIRSIRRQILKLALRTGSARIGGAAFANGLFIE